MNRVFMDQRGSYVDVGANHPVHDNNTYFFYSYPEGVIGLPSNIHYNKD